MINRCEYCGSEERYGHTAVCVMNEVIELRDALRRKDVLIEKLHVVAKNVSHALMSFTPGGSEYFTQVKVGDFEDYYADADACQRRVRERIDGAEDRARNALRLAPPREARAMADLGEQMRIVGLRKENARAWAEVDGLRAWQRARLEQHDQMNAEIERLTAALVEMRSRDDRNGSLPPAYREIIDKALAPAPEGRQT